MASEDWPFADNWSLHGNREIVSRYEILERIGEGTFGEVYRARRREDDLIVALKEVHGVDSLCREIRALLLLDHPNVVKVHEYFGQGNNTVLVLEYLPHNLYELIRATKGNISEGEVKGWIIQILRGLGACQAAQIIHRDLKPSNLLIAGDGTLKIADFGQARVIAKDIRKSETYDSENPENYVAGSENQCVTETLTSVGKEDQEQRTEIDDDENVSIGQVEPLLNSPNGELLTDKGESRPDGKTKSVQNPPQSTVLAPPEPIGGISDERESNDRHSVPSPLVDVALKDAVNDERNYFKIEEMARSGWSGTRMTGPHTSGLQGHDPGCCGWFALENAENRPGINALKRLSPGKGDEVNNGAFHLDRGYFVEQEDLSSDESDADWKGKYGIIKEDLIECKEQNWETHKGKLFSGPGKGEGDFLQKLGRFIGKRTRILTSEGRVGSTLPTRNGNTSRVVGKNGDEVQSNRNVVHKQCKESETKDSGHVGNKLLVQSENSPGDASGADENGSTSHDEQPCVNMRGSPMKSLGSEFHENESRRIKGGSTNGRSQGLFVAGDSSKNGKGLSDVVGLTNDNSMNETVMMACTRHESGGQPQMEKSQDSPVMRSTGKDDICAEGIRKSSRSVPEAKMEGKMTCKSISNGPLREMAFASAHEDCVVSVCKSNPGLKGDHEEKREVFQVGKYSSACTQLMNVLKSQHYMDGKEERCDDMVWCDVGRAELTVTSDNGVVEVNKALSVCPDGWKDERSADEMDHERWERNSMEVISGKEFMKSWEQTEGQSSALSDAEGTRWYGAPEFQFSYMEPRNEDRPGGKINVENGVTSASEKEWEYGLEGGMYQLKGMLSQKSSSRSDCTAEDGSDFTTMVGTRWYKAPELLYGARTYGMEVDMWAVGCVFGELLLGKPLFPGINDIDQLSRLVRVLGAPSEKNWAGVSLLPDFDKICFDDDEPHLTLREYLPHVSRDALHFLERLLNYDPARRPTAKEALADQFFFKSPLPCPSEELTLPTTDKSEASDEEWGDWKDPGSPFSDFEILG